MKGPSSISTLAVLATTALAFVSGPAPGQANANSALSFDGVDDLVIVPNHPLLELTDGTLELWFKPDWAAGSLAYDPVLIANRQGAALTRYSLHVDRHLAGVKLASGLSVSTVPFAFARGQWYHLAVVDGGATAVVYVDGQRIGETSNGFGTLIGLPLYLGSDGVGQFFRGELDEVRIWNVVRGVAELAGYRSRALAGTEPGLVACWRLDEGQGTTMTDATGNRLDGTLDGPAWSPSPVVRVNTSGALGMALDLVASRNTYVEVNPGHSLTIGTQFTFEAWIKPRTATCGTILARGDGTDFGRTDYIFQVGTDGTNCGVMKMALMIHGQWAASASELPLNVWTHVAVSYDGTAIRFYCDGLLDRVVPRTGTLVQSGLPLFIGRQGMSGDNYFDGTLDEVRVWRTARSAPQIQNYLNRPPPIQALILGAYWPFHGAEGAGAFDSSFNWNHGRIFNRPLRVPSFWAPVVTVKGANPLLPECHLAFSDPGVTVSANPVGLAGGSEQSFVLRPDGTVVGWGRNDSNGQTNIPPSATNVVAIAAGGNHSLALRADGKVIGWGVNSYGQTDIPPSATNVVAIAAGSSHSLALRADGVVIGWGSNGHGRTNVPPAATNVVAIAAGSAHSLALRSDGYVIGWGLNDSGQTNVPFAAVDILAIAAGTEHSLALRKDGSLIAWGRGDNGQTNIPLSATYVIAIAAGGYHNLALLADGTIIGWGASSVGQINIPSSATNVIAIAAGGHHNLALRADGLVIGWGYNSYGQATIPPGLGNITSAVAVRGTVNPNSLGTYVVTYGTTNRAGAVAAASRAVIVQDTQPPALTVLGANPFNLDAGAPFIDPGATAADSCEGSLAASIVRTGTVNVNEPASYTLDYSVFDSSGNRATATRTVFVRGRPSVLGFNAFFAGTNVVTGSPVVQFLADVDPNGLATWTHAEFGLTTAYPGRSAVVTLPAGYNVSTFYATLDGLVPGGTYHFRVAASNSLGVVYGPDETFTVPLLFPPGDRDGDGWVDQVELDAVLSNYWLHSPWLAMTNPVALEGGLFQFSLTNAGGWNFGVLMSTNLDDWELLPAPAWPVWQFVDPGASNQPQRYYRLQWP